ncbi:hypothetical protein Clacol_009480 [Clathrus columnatus]|uniref:DUF6699 domain-containing protein n=1 Tax=Clathrus columnatus TaxID=1419009 RepID=A0AAV5AR54_9AGAM|nr:hypothetical protein Clacol_009480 [Clathrus columnatus]
MAYYTTAYPTVASYFDKYHQRSSTVKSKVPSSRPTLNRSSSHHVPAPAPPSVKIPSPTYTLFSSNSPSSPQSSSSRARSRSFSNPAPAIESLLAYHPSDVLINYDLSHPPSQATVIRRSSSSIRKELSPSELDRPATYPPIGEMHITCPYLQWTCIVYPLSSHRSIVTVGDVLETLFRFLRKHVSGEEWHSEKKSTQENVRQAWLRRVKRQQTHKDREYEKKNGLRRIDWLEKLTVFQGLELVKGSRSTWLLHVRQGDKTVKFWNGSHIPILDFYPR